MWILVVMFSLVSYLLGSFVTWRISTPIVCGQCGRVIRKKKYRDWLRRMGP